MRVVFWGMRSYVNFGLNLRRNFHNTDHMEGDMTRCDRLTTNSVEERARVKLAMQAWTDAGDCLFRLQMVALLMSLRLEIDLS